MNKHLHNECEHNLKFCKKCNVVYCAKCKKEWNDHVPNYFQYYPIWSYQTATTGHEIKYETTCSHK